MPIQSQGRQMVVVVRTNDWHTDGQVQLNVFCEVASQSAHGVHVGLRQPDFGPCTLVNHGR